MTEKNNEKVFCYSGALSIKDFSSIVQIDPVEIIKFFFLKGTLTTINSALDEKECKKLCNEFGLTFQLKKKDETEDFYSQYLDKNHPDFVTLLTPVVTIMGHVDHGKTTLLDRIRKTNVAEQEFANITQHIGAYQIQYKNFYITFLDTPGHEAFTKMRAMGGQVAHIVVLVISADDGIQPQTLEAIQHAKLANIKIIVFVNKIDKGEKNLPELKQMLLKNQVMLEEFGGDVILLTGSAIKNQGIEDLLDAILLISEMEKYKTTLKSPAIGVIIETKVEKGLGNMATVLLSRGKLKIGDYLAMSSSFCKVKNIIDDKNKNLKELLPSQPAKISGFKDLPLVGDKFISFDSEKDAKNFYDQIIKKKEDKIFKIENKYDGNILSVLIKSDVHGTLEALKNILEKLEVKIVGFSVGPVNETDIQFASISNSKIVNFNQKVLSHIEELSKSEKVEIRTYKSIYQVEEDVFQYREKNKFIEKIESVVGVAEVIKIWHHSKIGSIAGSIVKSGKINLKSKIKLLRNGTLLTKSTIKSFKTEAFEIKEAKQGQECGIVIHNWNDVKVGDTIEAYEMIEKV